MTRLERIRERIDEAATRLEGECSRREIVEAVSDLWAAWGALTVLIAEEKAREGAETREAA